MRARANVVNKIVVWLPLIVFLTASPARAQPANKIPRIGYVSTNGTSANPPPFVESFRQGLKDFGYAEGKSIFVEFRYADGKLERVPNLVSELIQLKVDALILGTQTALRAAMQATKTIPIIMVINADPVTTGIIDSLARPGGNVTGVSTLVPRIRR